MIIGNGLLASAFKTYFGDDPDVIVFASGVSNSQETRAEEFLREKQILTECIAHKKLTLYFSTCSVNDPELLDTPYVIHKKQMEELARSSKDYAIFRLPQVVGKTPNSHTLTNYLYQQINSGTPFKVWCHAKRNLIDVNDVASIVNYLVRSSLAKGITENIASPSSISILKLVSIFEFVLGKKANYMLIDAGGMYPIDSILANEAASQTGINFDENYIEKLIRKYYGD